MRTNKKTVILKLNKKAIANLNTQQLLLIAGGKTKFTTATTNNTSIDDACPSALCSNACEQQTK